MWYKKKYLRQKENLDYMFRALESDDYAFKFIDDGTDFNENLNKVKELLTRAKFRAIEREKYYETLMNNVRTGVITISNEGKVHQANDEALNMFGIDIFTHINQLRRINASAADAIMSVEPKQNKNITITNESSQTTLNISATYVTIENKQLKVVAINDIANALDQKEIDSWIKLTRVLTHEIMNSLAPITSIAKTLVQINNNNDKNITKGLETICETSNSLLSFVESYRKFTKLQSPIKSAFDLKPLLEQSAHLISQETDYKDITININVTPADILIYADKNMILQVFVNIIKNAAQALYSTENKIIKINAYHNPQQFVVISFTNNGNIIPPHIAENIFTPFFTTKQKGSGIGLSISRQIMNLHDGSLQLTKNIEGEVTFTITM